MRTLTARRPSLGTVLGLTALIVAVVATASAAPNRTIVRKGDLARGAVNARAIARGAVRARALAKGAVTQRAVAKGAIGSSGLAANAVTASALSPGSVYGGALGSAIMRSAPIADPDMPPELSAWTVSGPVVVSCAQGERALSGGVAFSDAGNGRVGITKSAPVEDGWVGEITSDANGAAKAEVQVLCLR